MKDLQSLTCARSINLAFLHGVWKLRFLQVTFGSTEVLMEMSSAKVVESPLGFKNINSEEHTVWYRNYETKHTKLCKRLQIDVHSFAKVNNGGKRQAGQVLHKPCEGAVVCFRRSLKSSRVYKASPLSRQISRIPLP